MNHTHIHTLRHTPSFSQSASTNSNSKRTWNLCQIETKIKIILSITNDIYIKKYIFNQFQGKYDLYNIQSV